MPVPTLNENEVSLKIDMVSHLNLVLQKDFAKSWPVKKVGAEITINHNHKMVRFPDVVLFGDYYASPTSVVQMWEIKCPDVSIMDTTFVKDAQNKARSLRLNSTLTWNFQSCKLWKTDDGELFQCVREWNLHPEITISNRDDALAFIERYEKEWLRLLDEIFLTVNNFIDSGDIVPRMFAFDDIDSYISTLITDNIKSVREMLIKESQYDVSVEDYIEHWWVTAKSEFSLEFGNDSFGAYAKCLIANWTLRILFANIIKGVFFTARSVENIDESISAKEANDIFQSITNFCDFFNVFHPVSYSEVLSGKSWGHIVAFNRFLCRNGIATVSQDELKALFEATASASHREMTGQYTTPIKLAQILTYLTIKNRRGICIDPCCGSGTIVKSIIDYKLGAAIPVSDVYDSTWGSDINSFPLQIATMALTTIDTVNIPLKIFQRDVFYIDTDDTVSITNPANGTTIYNKIPEFDYLVSNLPFIDFNTAKADYIHSFNCVTNFVYKKTGVTLSGRSDVYAYILLRVWSILKDGARVGVIVSNSWMKSPYSGLFDALRRFYKIEHIIISAKERWFKNASVVTNLLILEKKMTPCLNPEEAVSFDLLNEKLENLTAEELSLIRRNAFQNKHDGILSCRRYTQGAIDLFLHHGFSLNALFYNTAWIGSHFNKFCPLNCYFRIKRGLKSGMDKAFYVKNDKNVDAAYLKPLLKSGKGVSSLIAQPDMFVISCSRDSEELKKLGHIKTLKWFESWETGMRSNQSASANARANEKLGLPWYAIRNINEFPADLALPMNNDKRFYCVRFTRKTIINQRMIPLEAKRGTDIDLCHALLNSILFALITEAGGVPMGDGALDNNKTTIERQIMPNPALINNHYRKNILKCFDKLLRRECYDFDKEIRLPDRIAFERAVLQAYGFESRFDEIVSVIKDMMRVRSRERTS